MQAVEEGDEFHGGQTMISFLVDWFDELPPGFGGHATTMRQLRQYVTSLTPMAGPLSTELSVLTELIKRDAYQLHNLNRLVC